MPLIIFMFTVMYVFASSYSFGQDLHKQVLQAEDTDFSTEEEEALSKMVIMPKSRDFVLPDGQSFNQFSEENPDSVWNKRKEQVNIIK